MQRSKIIAVSMIGATVLFFFVVAALLFQAFVVPPRFESLRSKITVTVKLKNGDEAKREFGPDSRTWVSMAQISPYVGHAVVASEDASFYSHSGIDTHEIKESIKKDVQKRRWARGGSTITQQLVKNAFLTKQKSVWRKIKEIVWAYQLEKVLSKKEILEFYLNLVEWGPGVYGISEASSLYFGKHPSQLSPKESAFLALLLPSPRKYHSYFAKKELTPWAQKRVEKILFVMKSMRFISEEDYEQALTQSLWEQESVVTMPDEEESDDSSEEE